jgi:hypothetical protein
MTTKKLELTTERLIAGALFDFVGYLTTRSVVLVTSERDNPAPIVDAMQEWATKRNFDLTEAEVRDWLAHVKDRGSPLAIEAWGEAGVSDFLSFLYQHRQTPEMTPIPTLDAGHDLKRQWSAQRGIDSEGLWEHGRITEFRWATLPQNPVQWHKNGDHPQDYAKDHAGYAEGGVARTYTGSYRKQMGWEGDVVRYYRNPFVSGELVCPHCRRTMHEHGWIDQREPQVVCPGDWVIQVREQHFPIKPALFESLFFFPPSQRDATDQPDLFASDSEHQPNLDDVGEEAPPPDTPEQSGG